MEKDNTDKRRSEIPADRYTLESLKVMYQEANENVGQLLAAIREVTNKSYVSRG